MKNNSFSDTSGPGSPYDPFPTPRIYPDKWDLSELVTGYKPAEDFSSVTPPLSEAGQDSVSLTDGSADESTANAL